MRYLVCFFLVPTLLSMAAAADESGYATVDAETGLFRNDAGTFALPCVTYVQCQPGRPGMNAGPIQVPAFDLPRIREDFRQMRAMGLRAIYMRVGTGMFLNPKGEWRRIEEPFTGIADAEQARADFLARLDTVRQAGIGPFTYMYEVFDYLLDCAAAEDLYVVPMIMDTWSLPRKYEHSEQMTAMLHEETWRSIITDWTKILTHYRDRREILGYLIEGETFHLSPWNDRGRQYLNPDGPVMVDIPSLVEDRDPQLIALFQAYLGKRHGSVEALRRDWGYGYDRSRPTHDAQGVPRYPYVATAFSDLRSLQDAPLPHVERARDDTGPGREKHFPYWLNVPFDPVWVDFAYFKDWIYTTRLNEFMAAIRAVDPHHLFFHSAAWDDVPVWHPFFAPWDHGALECDVQLLGGGYTDAVKTDDLKVPLHETVKELYQTVAPYRPWTYQQVGRAGAFGMGEGGFGLESNSPEAPTRVIPETDENRWVSMLLLDNFGSGSAMANLWDWSGLVGATVERLELHEHAVTRTLRELSAALARDTFSRSRDAKVLILSNGITLHSLIKEAAVNNFQALSSVLAMTHRAFDLATTDTVTFGAAHQAINLDQYDVIFIPQQFPLTLRAVPMNGPIADAPRLWPML